MKPVIYNNYCNVHLCLIPDIIQPTTDIVIFRYLVSSLAVFLSLIFQASYLFTKKFSIRLGKQIFEQQLWFHGLINNLFKFLSVCVTPFVLRRLKSSTIICHPGILHTTINKYSHSSLPAQYLFASHLHSILLFQLPIFISETQLNSTISYISPCWRSYHKPQTIALPIGNISLVIQMCRHMWWIL